MPVAPKLKNDTMFDPMPSAPDPLTIGASAPMPDMKQDTGVPEPMDPEAMGASGGTLPNLSTEHGIPAPINNAEGQTAHAAHKADFARAKNDISAGYLVSPSKFGNPNDYTDYLRTLREHEGAITHAEAKYDMEHPWGSMESSHPGFFGKLGHAFGQIGNVAGEALAPGLAEAIPGSHANMEQQSAQGENEIATGIKEGAEAAAANLSGQKAVTEAAKPGLMEAQGQHAQAAAGFDKAKTDAIGEPTKPDEQVLAAGQRIAQGLGTPKDFAMVKSFHDLQQMKNEAKMKNAPANIKAEYEQAVKDGDDAKAQQLLGIAHQYATATQPPQRPPQELVAAPNAEGGMTAQNIQPGSEIKPGTKSVKDLAKGPSNDELRRADLARNMNENMDQLEDIVNRRPDLFGPFAGRMTQLKTAVGTSDPDIAKANAIKEFMGMAAVGTHAMRNAQHVEAAANAIMNGYKNGPDAIKAAIQTGRSSVATFQQDAGEEPGSAPKGGASTPRSKTGKKDSLGIL